MWSHSSTATSTHLLTLHSGWAWECFRGHPTACPCSHLIPVLPTWELLSYSVMTAQREYLFTHTSQEHGVLMGRHLPGYGSHLGNYPTGLSTQELSTKPSLQSIPSPSVGQIWPWAPQQDLRQQLQDRSVTLGFTGCGLLPAGFLEAFTAPGHWACLHPPPILSLTPGSLSLEEGLPEILSHLWVR